MIQRTITCDRMGNHARAAVWQGKTLVDLYVDRIDAPDNTGAVVCGKVVRVLAAQKAAWVDCGLAQRVFVEGRQPLQTGQRVVLQIKSTLEQNKAWAGKFLKAAETSQPLGLLQLAPTVWQRALDDLTDNVKADLVFADAGDYQAYCGAPYGGHAVRLSAKEPVHPDLDERIDALCDPVVPLAGGASLVIEPTEALVAMDVNSGDAANTTAVNLAAVREAARQIRLRNLGGIIVIDCLKMKERADVSKVLNAFERLAQEDPAGVKSFGMTKLGLLEITRTRRGPSLAAVIGGK